VSVFGFGENFIGLAGSSCTVNLALSRNIVDNGAVRNYNDDRNNVRLETPHRDYVNFNLSDWGAGRLGGRGTIDLAGGLESTFHTELTTTRGPMLTNFYLFRSSGTAFVMNGFPAPGTPIISNGWPGWKGEFSYVPSLTSGNVLSGTSFKVYGFGIVERNRASNCSISELAYGRLLNRTPSLSSTGGFWSIAGTRTVQTTSANTINIFWTDLNSGNFSGTLVNSSGTAVARQLPRAVDVTLTAGVPSTRRPSEDFSGNSGFRDGSNLVLTRNLSIPRFTVI
jgi:hypothetical protein